jgi:hypothetical protein
MQITYPADIVTGAHDHEPGYACLRQFPLTREAGMGFGGEVYLIKCGTYQDSEFGLRYFGNGGRPMSPTVVLGPPPRRYLTIFLEGGVDATELDPTTVQHDAEAYPTPTVSIRAGGLDQAEQVTFWGAAGYVWAKPGYVWGSGERHPPDQWVSGVLYG